MSHPSANLYNTSVTCTYASNNHFTDNEIAMSTDEQRDYVIDTVYRSEFLKVLCLDTFDDKQVSQKLTLLGNIFGNHEGLKHLLLQFCSIMLAEDDERLKMDDVNSNLAEQLGFGMTYALSFQMLSYMHPCFCEYLTTGNVSNHLLENAQRAFKLDFKTRVI